MTTRSQRPRPLLCFLVLLISFVVFTSAWGFGASKQRSNEEKTGSLEPLLRTEQGRDQDALQHDGAAEQHEQPGAVEFLEASVLLQRIKPPPRRLARFTKPRGIVGATSYYGKESFRFLFMNGPPKANSDTAKQRKLREPLTKAVELLDESASQGNTDAIFKLAELNFYGSHTYPRNYSHAFERYKELADVSGNSTAQHMVGFMYATGIGGAVEKDQARALLYQTFAADAGDVRAQMTIGYRHNTGIATPRNCEKAVHYYKKVADKAMQFVRAGPPGGQQISKGAYRLADEDGGVYGEGASVSSSGANAKQGGPGSNEGGAFDNMLLYLDLMARKGELKATFGLARVHYDGSRALQRDFRTARDKFLDVARRYWTKDGRIRADTEPGVAKIASQAAGYLGRMFLRGEGMEQNFAKAQIWFNRGIANGDALCQYSMGLMHLYGLGVERNPVRAADYFGAAADQDFATAQVRLGALFMDQGNLDTATKYFELAARNGHIEAFYYLAEMANLGAGRDRNCNQAALYYKIVSEKAEPIHSNFGEANDAYEDGDIQTALPLYMQAAEQGYEAAQANVAYLLDTASGVSRSRFAHFISHLPSYLTYSRTATDKARALLGDAALALIYWTRSAKQANIDSLVKMGDYYLLGLGTQPSLSASSSSSSSGEATNADGGVGDALGRPDPEKAVACYSAAAETLQSAQALWNLGWMHENGLGVAQDFHLAKRFYDQCGETNKEAKTPVAVALLKLRVRSAWNWLVGGDVHGIDGGGSGSEATSGLAGDGASAADAGRKKFSMSGWFADFLAADLEDVLRAEREQDEWEADRYAGRDGRGAGAGAGAEQDGMYGDEGWEGIDDGILEMALIVALAGTLAVLIWYRQMVTLREQRRERDRRIREGNVLAAGAGGGGGGAVDGGNDLHGGNVDAAQAQAQAQGDAGGFFPAPGDPEYPGWVAGGVGH